MIDPIDVDLSDVGELVPISVHCTLATAGGREGLRVHLDPVIERYGVAGFDCVDHRSISCP